MTSTQSRSERPLYSGGSLRIGGGAISAASLAVSTLSYGVLPGRIRIRWTIGGPYYGLEFAPTLLVLIAFPVLIVGLTIAGWWVGRHLERTEGFDAIRPAYDVLSLVALGTLLVGQVVIVALNLGYP